MRRKKKSDQLRKIIYIFLVYKILIISIAYASYILIPENFTRRKNSDTPLLDPFAQLDARAYLDIAKNGYNADFGSGATNYGWFPLYPFMIKAFSFIGYELAALLIANIFSFVAVYLLYILVSEEIDKKVAYRTILYTLFFPTAFFLSVMYTESLFLSLSLATFIFAKRNKWHYSGVCGFLASMTRTQGFLLMLPIAYMYLRSKNFKFQNIDRKIIFVIIIPLGLFAVFFYHYLITGDPFIQFANHLKYERALTFPWKSIEITVKEILTETPTKIFYNSLNLFITALMVSLAYLSRKQLKKEYFIYFSASILLPLLSATIASITRFSLVIFPAFMIIAIQSKKHKTLINVIYAFSTLLMLLSTAWYANEEIDIKGLINFIVMQRNI